MSDFMDSEAEESGEELEETKEEDEDGSNEEEDIAYRLRRMGSFYKTKGALGWRVTFSDSLSLKSKLVSSSQAVSSAQDVSSAQALIIHTDENEINDIIDDNPIEEDEEDDDELPSRKRKLESDDDEVDDDDLELIKENTGINIKKKKHSRVKLLDSDEEDEDEEEHNERDQIAHDIFDAEDNEDDAHSNHSLVRSTSRQSTQQYAPIENIGDESDEEVEEIDDFIVDDDDKPIGRPKKKKSKTGAYTDSALQEAQDIFGLEFDLSEFDTDALDEERDYDEEDMEEEEAAAVAEQRKKKRKASKKSIYQIYEPTELEKSHLTLEDGKIKVTDIPERFQLRAVLMKAASDSELDDEAEWIYKQAFMHPPVSQQNFQDPVDPSKQHIGFEAKPVTAIPRIRAALSFMKKDLFEVPFIAMYRKEYVEPEMKKDDLWKVYEWDEKWTQLKTRKGRMKQLFENMQQYQFHLAQQNANSQMDEMRLIEQDDIDRLENAQNAEELMDVYLHFQLHYGNDVVPMQEWKDNQLPTNRKRMKKKTILVKKDRKKIPPKENAGAETDSENPSTAKTAGLPDENNQDESEEREKDKEEITNKINSPRNQDKTQDGEIVNEKVEGNSIDPETGEKLDKSLEDIQRKDKTIVEETNESEKNNENNESASEYEEQEIEVTDSEMEEENDNENVKVKKRKLPRRRDMYIICKDNGLGKIAAAFGLTSEQFGENMRDNYQRHEPEQHQQEPVEFAKEFICNTFPSSESVLSGACHMVAVQIAHEPLVKQTVRQIFYERAKIQIVPTRKGKKEIDSFHLAAPFKYLKSKPVHDLHGEQFFKMWIAEQEQLVKIQIGMEDDSNRVTFLDELKPLFNKDEFSHLVQEWNKLRENSLNIALTNFLYPALSKELKYKLLLESRDFAIQRCTLKLRSWLSTAPYQPDSNYNEDTEYATDNENSHGCRVMSCSFLPDRNVASFFAMLDADGQIVDFLRLKHLLFRWNGYRESERKNKEADMEKLKGFIKKHQPRVVAISAECRDAIQVYEDVNRVVQELEQEQQMSHIYVELVDGEVARIYQDSPRAVNEFREYPELLRHAVSVGRRIQEPLLEFAGLCDSEDELLCLRFHALQEYLPQEILKYRLQIEFINQVNEVGVDINRALDFPHTSVVVQFLCGLGPRKGGNLLKILRQQGLRLENRSQLVTVCEMGLQVFLNCAGFIRIEPSDTDNNNKYEVLDGTRIHPETYDWPRKMAVDALEYDDVPEDSNPSSAVEEILDQPERLKDLDLDAFAEELARQGYGNKQITLYDIRDELINRFKDHRVQFKGLSNEERFRLLTGETPQTLYYGKLITCAVTGFAYKKPTREELDSANPTRNDETNLWKCPFCLLDTFPDLSEVWTHFDNGSCPGQAVGVRTRLDNGITGFIATKNISDKGCRRPEERVRVGMTLHARVIKINHERMQLDLTCKSSDLSNEHGKFAPPRDLYYDQESNDKDRKNEEKVKAALAKRTTYLKRVIAHPSFKNVTFKDAEKLLETMEQGDCIIRPSSKGSDHLTVTWKVHKGIYQHIDIREEGKENAFSIGKSLWIDSEEYEDLDEILARHIAPIANHAREIISHKYYKDAEGGLKSKLEEILIHEKRKAPGRIPYFFSCAKQLPGKFMLGYMPRNKPRIEFVTVTPDGFRYRGRIHANTNNLLKWFKEHFRDPIPGAGTPSSLRRAPFGTPMSMMSSAVSNTPYTPGATPSNLISDEEAAKLMKNISYVNTPGNYSTPGGLSTPGQYSTPGQFSTPGIMSTPGSINTPGSLSTPAGLSTPGEMSTPSQFGTPGQPGTPGSNSISSFNQWNDTNKNLNKNLGNRTPRDTTHNQRRNDQRRQRR